MSLFIVINASELQNLKPRRHGGREVPKRYRKVSISKMWFPNQKILFLR